MAYIPSLMGWAGALRGAQPYLEEMALAPARRKEQERQLMQQLLTDIYGTALKEQRLTMPTYIPGTEPLRVPETIIKRPEAPTLPPTLSALQIPQKPTIAEYLQPTQPIETQVPITPEKTMDVIRAISEGRVPTGVALAQPTEKPLTTWQQAKIELEREAEARKKEEQKFRQTRSEMTKKIKDLATDYAKTKDIKRLRLEHTRMKQDPLKKMELEEAGLSNVNDFVNYITTGNLPEKETILPF